MRVFVPEKYLTESAGILDRAQMEWPSEPNADFLVGLQTGAMVIMDQEQVSIAKYVPWKHIKFPGKQKPLVASDEKKPKKK